ncbi:hypothetical protein JQN58_12410 [Aneurinibacillus sp. BA2021]|nr:hypothetical protein [Aneurinibacillus sp. BA2021]
MRKKAIFVTGCLAMILSMCTVFTTHAAAKNVPAVIVLFVPQLTREDIAEAYRRPTFAFLQQAAIGELNIRTALSVKDIHNSATLSAGTRAAGIEWMRQAYGIGEERINGLALYRQYTGTLPAQLRNGAILLPYGPALLTANTQRNTGAVPGLLGDTLKKHGINRMVIGNSDTEGRKSRLAPVLTMDRQGITPEGWIGEETVVHSAVFPGGKKTDYLFLSHHVARWAGEKKGLIVAELGDLERLSRYKNVMGEQRYMQLRQETAREILSFAGSLLPHMKGQDRLLLLSSSLPNQYIADKKRMAPILLWEKGEGGGGITSGTTRQPGLAANIDIAPSILAWLNLPVPDGMKGLPLTIERGMEHAAFFSLAEKIDMIYATRSAVLYPYVGLAIAVILFAAMSVPSRKWRGIQQRSIIPLLRTLLLVLLLIPYLLLLLSALPDLPPAPVTVLLLALTSVGLALLLRRVPFVPCFFWLGLAGWIPPLLDGLMGAELIRRSYMGYDPVIGARYYGIGNEYMGVMLGGAWLSVAMIGEWTKTWPYRRTVLFGFLAIVSMIIIFYMAWPQGGSKAGGILVFVAALLYGVPAFSGFVWRLRSMAVLLLFGLIAVALLFALNYQVAGTAQSHIGRAVGELVQGDWQEIGRIIERKLTMNWRLILASIWSKLFLVSFIVSMVLLYYRSERMREIRAVYPYFSAGLKTISFGALVALLVNDSGIIAAALAMLYVLVPLLYRLLDDASNRP